MKVFRGFSTMRQLVDNAHGVIPTLGEISPESLTFSRDITVYTHPVNKEFTYINMHRVDGGNANIDIPSESLDYILNFLDWISVAGHDGTITSDKETFLNNWIHQFPDMADEYMSGAMRTEDNYYLPERVEWKKGEDIYEIFFADDVMETYWQPWAIEVVPPCDNIDDLLQVLPLVTPIINSRSLKTTLQLITLTANEFPFTYQDSEVLQWHQYNNESITTDTDWALLQYGPAARDPENIRTTLRDYIITHSTKDETEWYPVYPQLFDPVLFYITPMWDKLAKPALTTTEGIYSPIVNPATDTERCFLFAPFSDGHVTEFLEFFPTRFNCLSVGIVGATSNKEGTKRNSELYPDYISVASTHSDFFLQKPLTQEWSLLLTLLIKAAETYKPDEWLPDDVVSSVKDGIVYLSTKHEGRNYLIVTKQSFLDTVKQHESEIGDSNNPK